MQRLVWLLRSVSALCNALWVLPPDGGLRLLLTPKSALPINDLDRARWMLRFALQLVMETPPEDAQSGARRG
jgi:hypothetical protein